MQLISNTLNKGTEYGYSAITAIPHDHALPERKDRSAIGTGDQFFREFICLVFCSHVYSCFIVVIIPQSNEILFFSQSDFRFLRSPQNMKGSPSKDRLTPTKLFSTIFNNSQKEQYTRQQYKQLRHLLRRTRNRDQQIFLKS